jgi:hypothetical protein
MSKKTVQEIIDEKKAVLRAQTSDAEYRVLLQTAAVQKEQDTIRARRATSTDRAALAWADKVAVARALLSLPADERASILDADTLLAKSRARAEAEAQLEVAQAAGMLPQADGAMAVLPKGKSTKQLPQSAQTGQAS